jgi:hypothetical protein
MHQLVGAELLDTLRLMVCPLVLPRTGIEPTFEGVDDLALLLTSTKVLDGRIIVLDYQPGGAPPHAQ